MNEATEHVDDHAQNFVSLRTYMEARHNALQKELQTALHTNAVAIAKAEQATEYRLANLNEFRSSLADQASNLASKQEVDSLRTTFEVRIEALRESHQAKIEALQWKLGQELLKLGLAVI